MINDVVHSKQFIFFSGNLGLAIVGGRIYTHAIDGFHCEFVTSNMRGSGIGAKPASSKKHYILTLNSKIISFKLGVIRCIQRSSIP